MPSLVKANEATAARRTVFFHLVDVTDGLTAELGEAGGQPQISTDSGAWTNTGIAVLTAIGNGRYSAALTQATVDTAGAKIETRYKSANTAECPGDTVHVVGFDPAVAFALASVCTEPRLAELAAGNLPTDVAANLTAIQAVQNNTRTTIGLPAVMERPDTGVLRFKIYLSNYDSEGNMEAPDSAPTVAVSNQDGTDRSGNLQRPATHADQATMVQISAGRYWIEYEMADTHAIEALNFTFTIVEGAVTRYADRGAMVVDTTAVDFTGGDRTILTDLSTRASEARLAELDAANLPSDLATILAAISTRSSHGDPAAAIAAIDVIVDAILAVTDKLDTAMEADGAVWRFTENALEESPAAAAAKDWSADELKQIRHRLGVDGDSAAPSATPSLATAAAVAALARAAISLTIPSVAGSTRNFTPDGDIVRGGRWPPADDSISVTVTKSSGWPVGAGAWTWKLRLSRQRAGGAADLELTSDGAEIDGSDIVLTFHATSAQTAALPGAGRTKLAVQLYSDDGAGVVSQYPPGAAYAYVSDPAGEG